MRFKIREKVEVMNNNEIPQVGDGIIFSKPFSSRAKHQPSGDYGNTLYNAAQRESIMISSRSLKRMSPYVSSDVEANNRRVKTLRAADMEKQNDVIGYYGAELNSSDSDACSIGSCSVSNHGLKNYNYHFIPAQCQETDTLCSDAESSYGSERKSSSLPLNEEVEVSIRSLELHAYRSTLEALYASGPLSWEQEAMLTNLRIMLHISNDQHLKELKHLISTKTAIYSY